MNISYENKKELGSSILLQRIRQAQNYVPPKFENGKQELYMNYSLFGPSPKCIQKLNYVESDDLKVYPQGGNMLLSQALSSYFDMTPDMFLIDNGAASVIELVFRAILTTEDVLLIGNPGWDYYRSVSSLMGIRCEFYNLLKTEEEFIFEEEIIINCIKKYNAKLVVVTSPNMPTGNVIKQRQLEKILINCSDTLLLVDQAYYGYLEDEEIDVKLFSQKYKNVVFVRTFSKLYSLASERVGYAIGNKELINYFRKISPLFGISYISQKMAAAALEDKIYYDSVAKQTIDLREKLSNAFKTVGKYKVYNSKSNFLLVESLIYPVDQIIKFLYENGYIIRDCTRGYNLSSHFRITIGTHSMVDDVIRLIYEFEKIHKYSEKALVEDGFIEEDGDFNL